MYVCALEREQNTYGDDLLVSAVIRHLNNAQVRTGDSMNRVGLVTYQERILKCQIRPEEAQYFQGTTLLKMEMN